MLKLMICGLLMEILDDYAEKDTYKRICLYI